MSACPYFILRGRDVVRAASLAEWDAFMAREDARRVAQTTVAGWWVSTVFLGLDHSYGMGPPQLFESMAFRDPGHLVESDCERYATWDEAVAGHEAMVRRVRERVS